MKRYPDVCLQSLCRLGSRVLVKEVKQRRFVSFQTIPCSYELLYFKLLYANSHHIKMKLICKDKLIVNKSVRKNLKELRNRTLSIILVWSLFFLIRVYVGLHFLQFLLKNQFFVFLCFWRFVFFCESDVLNQNIKMSYHASEFNVILFSLYKNSAYKYHQTICKYSIV